jgi:hypothetical protein
MELKSLSPRPSELILHSTAQPRKIDKLPIWIQIQDGLVSVDCTFSPLQNSNTTGARQQLCTHGILTTATPLLHGNNFARMVSSRESATTGFRRGS